MLTLIPEKIDFYISCVDLEVIYTENNTILKIEGQNFENYGQNTDLFSQISICFERVAEVKCVTLNFFECHYNTHRIIHWAENEETLSFWQQNGYHPDAKFYEIQNSDYLQSKKTLYDPKNRLNLKHFLVIGYDSYVEIVASGYKII